MAIVNDYKCMDCGLEITDDCRLFHHDEESGETVDYMLLMSTVNLGFKSRICGSVSETYCRDCNRHILVYTIREIIGEVENPCKTILEGVEKHRSNLLKELDKLNEIKRKEEYVIVEKDNHYEVTFPGLDGFFYSSYLLPHMGREEVINDALDDFHEQIDDKFDRLQARYDRLARAMILVVDENGKIRDDGSEKVNCPECGREIDKHIKSNSKCPRCGSRMGLMKSMCCD